MAQPLCFGQVSFTALERLFGFLTLGDVAPDAAIPDESPRLVEQRQPGDGDVSLAAAGCRPRNLEIAEGLVGISDFAVLAPSLGAGLDERQFPRRLADFAARCRHVLRALPDLTRIRPMWDFDFRPRHSVSDPVATTCRERRDRVLSPHCGEEVMSLGTTVLLYRLFGPAADTFPLQRRQHSRQPFERAEIGPELFRQPAAWLEGRVSKHRERPLIPASMPQRAR